MDFAANPAAFMAWQLYVPELAGVAPFKTSAIPIFLRSKFKAGFTSALAGSEPVIEMDILIHRTETRLGERCLEIMNLDCKVLI